MIFIQLTTYKINVEDRHSFDLNAETIQHMQHMRYSADVFTRILTKNGEEYLVMETPIDILTQIGKQE